LIGKIDVALLVGCRAFGKGEGIAEEYGLCAFGYYALVFWGLYA
jgi:hypothetical protein